jgi:hypothetical protein
MKLSAPRPLLKRAFPLNLLVRFAFIKRAADLNWENGWLIIDNEQIFSILYGSFAAVRNKKMQFLASPFNARR